MAGNNRHLAFKGERSHSNTNGQQDQQSSGSVRVDIKRMLHAMAKERDKATVWKNEAEKCQVALNQEREQRKKLGEAYAWYKEKYTRANKVCQYLGNAIQHDEAALSTLQHDLGRKEKDGLMEQEAREIAILKELVKKAKERAGNRQREILQCIDVLRNSHVLAEQERQKLMHQQKILDKEKLELEKTKKELEKNKLEVEAERMVGGKTMTEQERRKLMHQQKFLGEEKMELVKTKKELEQRKAEVEAERMIVGKMMVEQERRTLMHQQKILNEEKRELEKMKRQLEQSKPEVEAKRMVGGKIMADRERLNLMNQKKVLDEEKLELERMKRQLEQSKAAVKAERKMKEDVKENPNGVLPDPDTQELIRTLLIEDLFFSNKPAYQYMDLPHE